MAVRLIVVGEHELFVQSFRALLTQAPALVVVGVATARAEALGLAGIERPDVAVVVDVSAHDLGVVAELARGCKVLVVGARDAADARRALDAGARGVVGRTQTSAELLAAIRAVARGETVAPSWPEPPPAALSAAARLARLTPRERQVFDRLILGDTNAMIARHFGISFKTVDTHRTHLMRKLGVHSAIQLMRFAARCDLLSSEPSPKSALA